MKVKSLSRVRLLATPWTAAYQAPLPMGFSRQEYWSEVPLPSPKISYWFKKKKFCSVVGILKGKKEQTTLITDSLLFGRQ